jgi:hypothetical protein
MAKLSPLPSSIVVSARRTVSAGTWMEELPAVSCTAPWFVSWLTSGLTCRLMRPDDSTVGTKTSFTPYCLKVMVTSPFCWPTGMGNSPPARKLADWPLMAVRFGSARMRAMFSCTSALITPLKLRPRQPGPVPQGTLAPFTARLSAVSLPMVPILPRACQLTPSVLVTERDISAMRTCNETCTDERTPIWSSTVPPAPMKLRAMASTRAASSGVATSPLTSRPCGCC